MDVVPAVASLTREALKSPKKLREKGRSEERPVDCFLGLPSI